MSPEDQETWKRALARFRQEKDELFRSDPGSPLPQEMKDTFFGLSYFEPDPDFRFEANLQRYLNPDGVVVGTSKGTRQLFNRVGFFDLSVGGIGFRIYAFQSAERHESTLFIPFRDATSGKDSYGAARYLDLEVAHDDDYTVDFNYAYNPYCAYSDDYICPLPPRENWLNVAVRAGERKFHD
ncbi:MAG: DUF1684 domain-containing protein [Nitrososphaerota archaeon]|jgi:uncharacterized protein (DUF1684 family)|nr:DUF1684 domain-containing protein [Nitrososphaerota archaeon]MDG6942931.1 DUF1684 domain-containing protein [Nitrososphaerota archaeon]MDG6950659.1 DUF1684 domain-containing protein [Nitrososphaerota archaeon]